MSPYRLGRGQRTSRVSSSTWPVTAYYSDAIMSQSQQKRQRRAMLGDRNIRASVERLVGYEDAISAAMPEWWKFMDIIRGRRQEMASDMPGGWPDWCLMPTLALHKAIPSGNTDSDRRNNLIAKMLGLYAWRQGRTVWRFDSDVAIALLETEDTGVVPAEVLMRLPQWGVYIQRPDDWKGYPDHDTCQGILARLTTQAMFDFGDASVPVLEIQYDVAETGGIGVTLDMVPLIDGISLDDALALVRTKLAENGRIVNQADNEVELIRPWVALLIYLCTKGADIDKEEFPGSPTHHTAQNAPAAVTHVDVGFRVGAAIPLCVNLDLDSSPSEMSEQRGRPRSQERWTRRTRTNPPVCRRNQNCRNGNQARKGRFPRTSSVGQLPTTSRCLKTGPRAPTCAEPGSTPPR